MFSKGTHSIVMLMYYNDVSNTNRDTESNELVRCRDTLDVRVNVND